MEFIFRDINGKKHDLPKNRNVSFRPGCYAIIKEKNKFLMILDEDSAMWELPGGGLDIGENFFECVIRETKEETGYDVEVIDKNPFYISTTLDYFRKKDTFHQCIDIFILCELKNEVQGEQKFDDDENILEVKWFSKEEIKDLNIPNIQRDVVKKIIEEL